MISRVEASVTVVFLSRDLRVSSVLNADWDSLEDGMTRNTNRSAAIFLLTFFTAAPAWSLNDPVDEIASGRFTFTENGHRVTVTYEATHSFDEQLASITRLVFMIHGILRNTDVYHPLVMDAYRAAGEPQHVAVISPQFLTAEDIVEFNLEDDVPYWTRGGWSAGHLSRNEGELPRPVRVSSYAVLDRMLERALRAYPSLEEVIIAGHSAGGQFVNRYAAGSRAHELLAQQGVAITYIIANPSSYLYFCDHRPISHHPIRFAPVAETEHNDCEGFDNYRYGLTNLNAYMQTAGAEQLAERFASRRVIYFLGARDNDPEARFLARGCAAMAQGAHRLERGIAYYHYMAFLFGPEVHERHSKVIVPGVAHSARGMYTSRDGVAILFEAREIADSQGID
jgi:pimeloyl-ACP methyl ester carboxylesterase